MENLLKKIVTLRKRRLNQTLSPPGWDDSVSIFKAMSEDLSVEVLTGYCSRSNALGYLIAISRKGNLILLIHREEVETTHHLIEQSCQAIYDKEVGLLINAAD